jgi:hypothetical protein
MLRPPLNARAVGYSILAITEYLARMAELAIPD